MNIFELSVTGAVLIFAVILFRAVGKKRLPMRTFTVLWHVALLRLLLPFGLPSPFSAASIGQNVQHVPVVADGLVITGQGPGAATLFALVVLAHLTDDRIAHGVANGMITELS